MAYFTVEHAHPHTNEISYIYMENVEFVNNSEIFIHIGYPKTGTTFLQRRVFPRLKESNHRLGSLIDIDLPKYGYIW